MLYPKQMEFLHFTSLILLFLLHLTSSIHCNNPDQSLESILHQHAMFHRRRHTGALYNATIPSNLTGIKISSVTLRTTTLWKSGANFSDFFIPPRTLPVPYVKRLLIVYHNLGNWSSSFYTLSGYILASPVVGLLVYDGTELGSKNLSKLKLNTMGKGIWIEFGNGIGMKGRVKCAAFDSSGEVVLSEMRFGNVCYSRSSEGHFSIVMGVNRKKEKMWPFWIMGFMAGLVGMVIVGLAVAMAVRSSVVGKKSEEIADDGECLQTYWIGNSKMPVAEVTRTQPVLETTILPSTRLSWYA